MRKILRKFLKNESGATAIEYGLIAALMGVAVIGAVGALAPTLETAFGDLADGLGRGSTALNEAELP